MIDLLQFRQFVVEPTLADLDMGGEPAVRLLTATALQESRLTYLRQLEQGPALGIYQMEPATHDDIWTNYLDYRSQLVRKIRELTPYSSASVMLYDMRYATIMARLHYRRVPERLPEADDLEGMADYWKKYYNTEEGQGTTAEFITNSGRLFL
jgi:hypothetical protein